MAQEYKSPKLTSIDPSEIVINGTSLAHITVEQNKYGQHALDPKKPMLQRMLDGELYTYKDEAIMQESKANKAWMARFNTSIELLSQIQKTSMLIERFGHVSEGVNIRPPFYCNFGKLDNVVVNELGTK